MRHLVYSCFRFGHFDGHTFNDRHISDERFRLFAVIVMIVIVVMATIGSRCRRYTAIRTRWCCRCIATATWSSTWSLYFVEYFVFDWLIDCVLIFVCSAHTKRKTVDTIIIILFVINAKIYQFKYAIEKKKKNIKKMTHTYTKSWGGG